MVSLLAAYLGLVPSLHASGTLRDEERLRKTGNGHIRRALVQAAWQYLENVGRLENSKRDARITIADEAQRRLTKRARRLLERRKHANKVVIAIAASSLDSSGPRSSPTSSVPNVSRTAVDQRREVRKEKRARLCVRRSGAELAT